MQAAARLTEARTDAQRRSRSETASRDRTGLRNMQQLIQLRWIAVVGQLAQARSSSPATLVLTLCRCRPEKSSGAHQGSFKPEHRPASYIASRRGRWSNPGWLFKGVAGP